MAKLGIKCKLYRNTGSYGTPTWDEVPIVGELTQNSAWDEGEVLNRTSRVAFSVKTLLRLSFTVKMKADLTDADYTVFANAADADTVVDLMILDGVSTTNGVRGYRFESQIFSRNQDQGPGVIVHDEFTIKPTDNGTVPSSVLVASGAPVFTSLSA